MLGQPSKRALLFHLKDKYDISIDDDNRFFFSLEKLLLALQEIFGVEGARLIMEQIYVEMDRIVATKARTGIR